jgi:hypothetical protein
MAEIAAVLVQWQHGLRHVRERMYRAPTPRERDCWHVRWQLARGWSASKVGELLERDDHTIGACVGMAELAAGYREDGGVGENSDRS